MKNIGAILFGFVLLDSCFGQTCPNCTAISKCDSIVRVRGLVNKTCSCSICVNFCWDRFPRCVAGEVCVLEPVDCPSGYNCGRNPIYSAVCKTPFTGCILPSTNCTCPESGFLKDQNNCDSCLCDDPCKELKCPEGTYCEISSITPNVEPDYNCV